MIIKRVFWIGHGSVSLVCLLLLLCATNPTMAQSKKGKKGKQSKSRTAQADLSEEEQAKVKRLFYGAISAKMKDDMETAIARYKDCLDIKPNNAAVLYDLAKIYIAKDAELAKDYASRAAALEPDNKWYQFLYADILSRSGSYAEAASVFEKLIDKHPDSYEHYFDLAHMYIQAEEYEKAVNLYERLENNLGLSENISMQKYRLFLQLNKKDKATDELLKLIASAPENMSHQRKLAEHYMALEEHDKALGIYETLVKKEPENPEGYFGLARFYYMKGDKEKAFDKLEKAFSLNGLPLEMKVNVLSMFIQGESVGANPNLDKRILKLAETTIKTHPNEAMSYVLYGDLLMVSNERESALEQFRKAAAINGNNLRLWEQIMNLELGLGKMIELAEDSKKMIELYPNQALAYYYNGIAHNRLENYDKAVKTLKQGAMRSAKNPDLAAKIHSMLGDTYYDMKDYDKSDSSFEKALALKPDDPTTLNNYSYYLSEREEKLDKAEQMSLKSNELEPGVSSYQDTYAWILYKQDKFTDAKTWIEKALASGGSESPIIIEHYGDILYKLGEEDKAVQEWMRAQEKGSTSELLDKKIKNRKLYE